jgi:hypothetical protein
MRTLPYASLAVAMTTPEFHPIHSVEGQDDDSDEALCRPDQDLCDANID